MQNLEIQHKANRIRQALTKVTAFAPQMLTDSVSLWDIFTFSDEVKSFHHELPALGEFNLLDDFTITIPELARRWQEAESKCS